MGRVGKQHHPTKNFYSVYRKGVLSGRPYVHINSSFCNLHSVTPQQRLRLRAAVLHQD